MGNLNFLTSNEESESSDPCLIRNRSKTSCDLIIFKPDCIFITQKQGHKSKLMDIGPQKACLHLTRKTIIDFAKKKNDEKLLTLPSHLERFLYYIILFR